jgi:hypothetical protein
VELRGEHVEQIHFFNPVAVKPKTYQPLHKWNNMQENTSMKQAASKTLLLHVGFLLGSFYGPEDGGEMFFRNAGLTFTGLHGITSQKTKLKFHHIVRHPLYNGKKQKQKTDRNHKKNYIFKQDVP